MLCPRSAPPPEFHPVPERHGALQLPGIQARLSGQVGQGQSLSPGCCKALSSASKSASWGSSPTAAPETPVRQDRMASRLPRGAPEPGGSMSTVGPLFPLEAPLGPGVALAWAGATPLNASLSWPPGGRGGGSLTFVLGGSRGVLSVSGCWLCLWGEKGQEQPKSQSYRHPSFTVVFCVRLSP